MGQLAIYLIKQNTTVEDMLRDVTFRRTVNGKSYDTVEADDFFLTLNEIGITPKIFHLKNLRNYLAVD